MGATTTGSVAKQKITRSFSLDKEGWDIFVIGTAYNNDVMSTLMDEFIKEYNIKNKDKINDAINKFWQTDTKNNDKNGDKN